MACVVVGGAASPGERSARTRRPRAGLPPRPRPHPRPRSPAASAPPAARARGCRVVSSRPSPLYHFKTALLNPCYTNFNSNPILQRTYNEHRLSIKHYQYLKNIIHQDLYTPRITDFLILTRIKTHS